MSMTNTAFKQYESSLIDLEQVKKKQRMKSFFKGMSIFITIYYFI